LELERASSNIHSALAKCPVSAADDDGICAHDENHASKGMTGFFVPHDLKAPLRGAASGPLAGLAAVVKDMYAIRGERTGAGNPDWLTQAKPAAAHCTVVQKLLDAGATITGKTVCDEFFYSVAGVNAHYGTPANLRAPGRIPGGSSSGSAAATAAGVCDFALGSDTGGSVRIPASLCGLYGIRTSHGRIDTTGVMDMAPSFDTVGWFASSAGVLRKVGDVLLGGTANPSPVRTLLIADDGFEQADPPVAALLRDALGAMSGALPQAKPVGIAPEGFDPWREAVRIIQAYEIWKIYGPFVTAAKPRFGPGVAERMQTAANVTTAAADAARMVHAAAREKIRAQITPGTVVALPSAPCIAPKLDTPAEAMEAYRVRVMRLTCIAGLGGLPQVSIPVGAVAGCPVGLSLIGWPGGDEALLELAVALSRYCGLARN
jgi:amidase